MNFSRLDNSFLFFDASILSEEENKDSTLKILSNQSTYVVLSELDKFTQFIKNYWSLFLSKSTHEDVFNEMLNQIRVDVSNLNMDSVSSELSKHVNLFSLDAPQSPFSFIRSFNEHSNNCKERQNLLYNLIKAHWWIIVVYFQYKNIKINLSVGVLNESFVITCLKKQFVEFYNALQTICVQITSMMLQKPVSTLHETEEVDNETKKIQFIKEIDPYFPSKLMLNGFVMLEIAHEQHTKGNSRIITNNLFIEPWRNHLDYRMSRQEFKQAFIETKKFDHKKGNDRYFYSTFTYDVDTSKFIFLRGILQDCLKIDDAATLDLHFRKVYTRDIKESFAIDEFVSSPVYAIISLNKAINVTFLKSDVTTSSIDNRVLQPFHILLNSNNDTQCFLTLMQQNETTDVMIVSFIQRDFDNQNITFKL